MIGVGIFWKERRLPTETEARAFVAAAGLDADDGASLAGFILRQPPGRVRGHRIALVASLLLSPPRAWSREPGDDDDADVIVSAAEFERMEPEQRVGVLVPLGDVWRRSEARRKEVERRELYGLPPLPPDVWDAEPEVVDDIGLPPLEVLEQLEIDDPLPGLQVDWRSAIRWRWEVEQDGKSNARKIEIEQKRLDLLVRRGLDKDAERSRKQIQTLRNYRKSIGESWHRANRNVQQLDEEIAAEKAKRR